MLKTTQIFILSFLSITLVGCGIKIHSYGYRCGFVGGPPKGRVYIEDYIKYKNIEMIEKWIKSSDAEKNAYAIEAINRLQKEGVNFSQKILEKFEKLKRSDKTVHTCNGCLGGSAKLYELF